VTVLTDRLSAAVLILHNTPDMGYRLAGRLSRPDAADASLAVELSGNIPGRFPDVDFTRQGFALAHRTCLFR
jgi:hypothetical protein